MHLSKFLFSFELKFEYCFSTFLFKAFIRRKIFTSNRLCFKMAYSDNSRSPYFLLKKIDIYLFILRC